MMAITSVSVAERKSYPMPVSSARSACELVMVPLCTSAMRRFVSQCGWAFSSVLPPCVAHRVWAMPMWWSTCRVSDALRSRSMESAVVPCEAYFVVTIGASADPATVAIPAESYPRFCITLVRGVRGWRWIWGRRGRCRTCKPSMR